MRRELIQNWLVESGLQLASGGCVEWSCQGSSCPLSVPTAFAHGPDPSMVKGGLTWQPVGWGLQEYAGVKVIWQASGDGATPSRCSNCLIRPLTTALEHNTDAKQMATNLCSLLYSSCGCVPETPKMSSFDLLFSGTCFVTCIGL